MRKDFRAFEDGSRATTKAQRKSFSLPRKSLLMRAQGRFQCFHSKVRLQKFRIESYGQSYYQTEQNILLLGVFHFLAL